MKEFLRYLSFVILLFSFTSCSESKEGIIELKSLKNDTVIIIHTEIRNPDN